MLARVEPHLERAAGEAEIVELLAVERPPERSVLDAGLRDHRGDQLVVALHGVGREISEPDAVGGRRRPHRHHAALIAGVDPLPFLAVGGHAAAIFVPAVRIGRPGGVEQPQLERPAAGPGHPEIIPLVEVGLAVLGDLEVETIAFDGDHADVAAVEGARNG
jgi:hypothetical protein